MPYALPSAAPPDVALVRLADGADVARLAAVVILGAVLAAVVRRASGLGNGRDEIVATGRAAAQLAIVGLLITAVLTSWTASLAFVALMIGVATATCGGRLRLAGPARWWPLLPVAAGAVPVTAALLCSGLLPAEPVSVIPTAGILVGNSMTATTLGGKRALDSLLERRGEHEAALSVGLAEREAALLVARDEARLALVPGLDQTRTVGLVTLPGAFVGALLGGAGPLHAAALQLVVLVGILLAQSVSVALVLELVVRGRLRRR